MVTQAPVGILSKLLSLRWQLGEPESEGLEGQQLSTLCDVGMRCITFLVWSLATLLRVRAGGGIGL
jgi:hypothetical protein